MRLAPLAWVLLGLGAAGTVGAQDTLIYRCTDARGAVTLQNDRPCAKGSRQDIRRLPPLPRQAPPPPPPAPVAPGAAPVAGDFELVMGPHTERPTAAPPAPPARPPPPALFHCQAEDGAGYFNENAEPEPHCAPLTMIGVGGNPGLGAGTACEMRRDPCTAIPAEQLCRTWQRRVDEAEFRWKFAGADERDPRKREFERLAGLLRESACGG
jgi:hypothetical protein